MSTAIDFAALPSTRDAFLGGAVSLYQPLKGYRAGIDAVLLAAAIPERGRLRLLDVGAGIGTVGLCAAVRLDRAEVTLVERDGDLVRLAAANIAVNALQSRARVIEHDIFRAKCQSKLQLVDNGFDITVSNPPFYDASNHRQSPHHLKAGSHRMPDGGLDEWVRYMARMTRAGGTAIVIHRADNLTQLLAAFSSRFGALTLVPLHPRVGEPASRVILRGIKGSRAPMTIRSSIALHGSGNAFTPPIDKVLKEPTALDLDGQ